MDEILRSISSPSWWLGVVVVSFIINLASAYAKPLLDRILVRISSHRRHKLESAHQELIEQLRAAEGRPNGVVLLSIQELKLVVVGAFAMVLCILVILTIALPIVDMPISLAVLVLLCLIIAMVCMREAHKKSQILNLHEASRAKDGA